MNIPADLQKTGREFAIMAMDRTGKVIILYDEDKDPNKVTVTPNIEGYAYVLIYKD